MRSARQTYVADYAAFYRNGKPVAVHRAGCAHLHIVGDPGLRVALQATALPDAVEEARSGWCGPEEADDLGYRAEAAPCARR